MSYIKENEIDGSLSGYSENDIIKLTLVVGEGQYGSSAFKNFNGQIEAGAILNRILGSAGSIKGKKLIITTTVTDTNPDTNRTSVSYQLNGKNVDTLEYEVEQDNGTLVYYTTLNFI